MSTKKSPTHAGRKVPDDEVKTAEHDALLTWLIDHLQLVGNAIQTLKPGWIAQSAEESKPEIMEKWARVAKALAPYTRPNATAYSNSFQTGSIKALSDELQSSVSEAVARFKRWSEAWPCEANVAGVTEETAIVKYEVMRPVFQVTHRSMSEDKLTPAGFVDMTCIMGMACRLVFANGIAHLWNMEGLRDSLNDDDEPLDVHSLSKLAVSSSHEGLVWARKDVRRPFWFTVRMGAFTLGEVLQELKTLQDLSDGKDPDPRPDRDFNPEHKVVLVVNGIDPAMKRHIEHEGFIVVDRSVFPSE